MTHEEISIELDWIDDMRNMQTGDAEKAIRALSIITRELANTLHIFENVLKGDVLAEAQFRAGPTEHIVPQSKSKS
jgi:hypothetical protein